MTTTTQNDITIRPGDARGTTNIGWLNSRHSFSFGAYRDPSNMGYRSLRVINDDIVAPAGGFGEHGHDNMEIMTWVLDGTLRHGDSLGNMRDLNPGELQVMTAGTGIMHSELNASDTRPVHFLQIWIIPATQGADPRYLQESFDAAGRQNQWQSLASGHGTPGAAPINQDAELRVADIAAGQTLDASLGDGRHAYLHVATGEVTLNGQALKAGDAATYTGGVDALITATGDAQVLLFDLA